MSSKRDDYFLRKAMYVRAILLFQKLRRSSRDSKPEPAVT